MMAFYKETVGRTAGNGLKLPKFHEVIHVPSDIKRIGPPREINEGHPESSLKEFAKHPAQVTQKRASVVSQQAGICLFEHLVIEHAHKVERGWPSATEATETTTTAGPTSHGRVGTRFNCKR